MIQALVTSCDPLALIEARFALKLEPRTFHVWSFGLQGTDRCLALCRVPLSPNELVRADQFHRRIDRDAYTIAHGVLRHLLACYCDIAPEALRLISGPGEKPYLDFRFGAPPISFNLAHSNGRALLAIGDGREVGVDLERVRSDIDVLSIAKRFFFDSEFEDIATARADEQLGRFFRYWVAKEAVLKAQGIGLGFPLDRFHVRFAQRPDEATVVTFDRAQLSNDWVSRMLPLDVGWCGAIAARGNGWTVVVKTSIK